MKTNKAKRRIISRLENSIYRLNQCERQWLRLRVEFLLYQTNAALKSQYKRVLKLEEATDLLEKLNEAMVTVKRFHKWFNSCVASKDQLTLEKYLSVGVCADAKDVEEAGKILGKMMTLLPRWLNIECRGCSCRQKHVLLELKEGYRISMLQGT